jgi:hypothetical protein
VAIRHAAKLPAGLYRAIAESINFVFIIAIQHECVAALHKAVRQIEDYPSARIETVIAYKTAGAICGPFKTPAL